MTPDDVRRLFVVLAGYWPSSSPDPDDDLALAGHADLLREVTLTQAVTAARVLAVEGREFCPPPGVLVKACRPEVVPPERVPYELMEVPPLDHEQQLEKVAELREVTERIAKRLPPFPEGGAA